MSRSFFIKSLSLTLIDYGPYFPFSHLCCNLLPVVKFTNENKAAETLGFGHLNICYGLEMFLTKGTCSIFPVGNQISVAGMCAILYFSYLSCIWIIILVFWLIDALFDICRTHQGFVKSKQIWFINYKRLCK